jgi:hypothetical protein
VLEVARDCSHAIALIGLIGFNVCGHSEQHLHGARVVNVRQQFGPISTASSDSNASAYMTRMLGNAYYGDLPLVMQSMTSRRHETAPARHDEGTMADAPPPTTGADAVSDYGSDIGLEDFDEDTILADALCTIQAARPPAAERGTVLPSIEFEEGEL